MKANMDKIAKTQKHKERTMLNMRLTHRKTRAHVVRLKWSFVGYNTRERYNR